MDDHTPSNPGRRAMIKTAALATGTTVLATGSEGTHAADYYPPPTTPFVDPLPTYTPKAPTVLNPAAGRLPHRDEAGRLPHQAWSRFVPRKFYSMEARENNHTFHRDLPQQKIWGFDGKLPGPTIVAYYGEPVILRIYNKLDPDVNGFGSPELSLHLHNGHQASESDGYAGDWFSRTRFGPTLTRPGKFYDYHYPNVLAGIDAYPDTYGDASETMGTMWYHDHRENFTAANVYKGLAGFYLIFDKLDSNNENDPNPAAFHLPSGVGVYDIPMVLNDYLVDASGYVRFDQFETNGILGNKFAVNGKIQPFFSVARRKYRFRLLDAGPSRFYELYIVHKGVNQPFKYIASDGNIMPAPLTMTKLNIAPAERHDIIVDFAPYQVGDKLYLVNRLKQTDGRGPEAPIFQPGPDVQIMRFDVDRNPTTPDMSQVPAILRPLPPIALAEAVTKRSFRFDRLNGAWTTNYKTFDVMTPSFKVKRGSAEIWTISGNGGWHHPVHIHLEEARMISRNGLMPPPHERGRKDVFVLNPGDEIKLFVRFRDFTGKYMMHCHNLVHEDHSMMLRFDVVP